MEIDVLVQDEAWRTAASDIETLATRAAEVALAVGNYAGGDAELSIALADDAAVAALNAEWRGRDGPTNVLSFALETDAVDAGPGPIAALGDVVLARETILAEARRDGRTVDDHTAHLVVHGVLHLLGYDHEDDDDAVCMEAAETAAMRAMNRPDPHAEAMR